VLPVAAFVAFFSSFHGFCKVSLEILCCLLCSNA